MTTSTYTGPAQYGLVMSGILVTSGGRVVVAASREEAETFRCNTTPVGLPADVGPSVALGELWAAVDAKIGAPAGAVTTKEN